MATTNQPGSDGSVGQETETGLDENVAAALSYVLGFVTGVIMFIVESENDHVRFHAAQSIVVSGALFVVSVALNVMEFIAGFSDILGFILGAVLGLISLLLSLGGFVLWIYLIVRTYQGENPRIPVAAGVADGFV
jgi:uncharacterized membrane protein